MTNTNSFILDTGGQNIFCTLFEKSNNSNKTCTIIFLPLFEERMWSHRIAYNFALQSTQKDNSVLMWDYYGYGESEGDSEDFTLNQCCKDTSVIIEHLKKKYGYTKFIAEFCAQQISPAWPELRKRCQSLLKKEEQLREVAEIVGAEGLQDEDRLLMHGAEQIRRCFLCQNSFTDDAFSSPEQTFALIEKLVGLYDEGMERLKKGDPLPEILQECSL